MIETDNQHSKRTSIPTFQEVPEMTGTKEEKRQVAVVAIIQEYQEVSSLHPSDATVRMCIQVAQNHKLSYTALKGVRNYCLYGPPMKYAQVRGGIKPSDFLLTDKDLADAGIPLENMLLEEYKRGFDSGVHVGYNRALMEFGEGKIGQ